MRRPRNGENRSGGKHPFGHDHRGRTARTACPPAGMSTRTISHDIEDDDEPVDLVAVQADDELINALAVRAVGLRRPAAAYDADDRSPRSWPPGRPRWTPSRSPNSSTSTPRSPRCRPRAARPRRARHLVPLAAAAAGAGDRPRRGVDSARTPRSPSDTLWPVAKVLFTERAESVEAAARVEDRHRPGQAGHRRGPARVAAAGARQAAAADLGVVRAGGGPDRAGRGAGLPARPRRRRRRRACRPIRARRSHGDQTPQVPPGAQITAPAARTSERVADGAVPEPGHRLDQPAAGAARGAGAGRPADRPTRRHRLRAEEPEPSTRRPAGSPPPAQESTDGDGRRRPRPPSPAERRRPRRGAGPARAPWTPRIRGPGARRASEPARPPPTS